MEKSTDEHFTLEIKQQFANMVNDYLKSKGIHFEVIERSNELIKLRIHQVQPDQAFYLGVRLQKSMTEGVALV